LPARAEEPVPQAPHSAAIRRRRVRAALAGGLRWFALYVAVGGLLSFCVAREHAPFRLFAEGWVPPPACLPQRELFDTIASRCPVAAVNWFWFVLVGLPRLCIVLVALPILLFVDTPPSARLAEADDISLRGALVFGLETVLVLAVFSFGIRGWWRRRGVTGIVTTSLIALDLALYSAGLAS
jgi:hypothetical protein